MNAAVRWPTQYTPLDGGRLLVRPDYVGAFEERGWTTLNAVMNAEVDVVRRVGERDNCRLRVGGTNAYLKRHWESHSFLARPPSGRWEADAVGWCMDASVPTMGLIAAGADGQRSFFLSEEIAGGVPADDFWKANPNHRTREQVVVALAETARRFHAAGLFHRDFYWCHFFIRPSAGSVLTAHLIDLQRVARRPWLGWRWRIKDLGQFWFSAPADVTAEDRKAWFEVYSDQRRGGATEWAALLRAGFYRLKDGRP